MPSNPLLTLKSLGQSVWLDYIQRNMLDDGTVARLIEQDGLAGMTSNPVIFKKAITEHDDYDKTIAILARRGASTVDIYDRLVLEDVRHAADLFRPVYEGTDGRDGFVSLEVSPRLAYDADDTVSEGKRLWAALDRPNVMIKVPATREGLAAIERLIAAGVNVNVTLLFGLRRYDEVIQAFMSGLEKRIATGQPVESMASVASFFVSRIDTLVDSLLDKLIRSDAGEDPRPLRGRAAIACARLAYQDFKAQYCDARWQALASRNARPQRLLWASTGTKDPAYSDVKYVEGLIGPDTVITLPPETLNAYREHGRPQFSLEHDLNAVRALPAQLSELSINLDDISQRLEEEGVQKFVDAHDELLATLDRRRTELAA
ncbi:MAG: transaldolase [Gammaproteobacteria bacterium]